MHKNSDFADMNDQGMLGGLHPFMKLLLLVLLMISGMLVVFFIGMVVTLPFSGLDLFDQLRGGDRNNLNMLRYLQILSHLGLFVIPGFLFAYLVDRRPMRYLRGGRIPRTASLVFSALLMIAAVPVVYVLMQYNQQLSLPEALGNLEQWMRQSEDAAEEMMAQFLNVSGGRAYFFNIMMIAVLPAIGEEFIFRGAIQRIFKQWTGSSHLAVFIAAVLFSAMHLQFFRFLPLLLLGIFLGYMFVITKNIWVPVFAHFFNNAAAVTFYYLAYNTDMFSTNAIAGGWLALYIIVLSIAATIWLFIAMKRIEKY